ncbi:MAG: aerobic carbon-monoxide dehydrogenase large subunit [Thermoleophilaceae bacterium]|nr:aerobic carbon-monoxide dehydrogenase large subunit [Thermoleophilaceae bacterium]
MTTSTDSAIRPQNVGARVPRLEDPRFLTGRARYIDDLVFPRALHAAFVRSPYAHARIAGVDASAALELDGVAAVYTGADMESLVGPLTAGGSRPEVRQTEQRVLPVDRALYSGEPVAVVLADSRYIAEDACELVRVEWERLPAVLDPVEALQPGAPVLHEGSPDNNTGHIENSVGDVEGVFERADHVFSTRFHTGRYAAMPLEPRGIAAEWDAGTGVLKLWTASQIPHLVRGALAGPLGISENRIEVITPALGGGFGLKSHVFVEEALLAAVARLVDRPVKWIEDRYEHLAASTHAKELIADVEMAVAADGTFLGLRGKYMTDAGAYSCIPYTAMVNALDGATISASLYKIENVGYTVDAPFTNKCQMGAYRGIGWGPVQTAREVLIDQIATALGRDPVELRLQNMIESAPYKAAMGQTYDSGSYHEAVKRACEVVDYEAFRALQAELREQGRHIGIGITPYVEVAGLASEMARANDLNDGYTDQSRVTVEPDGSVTITTGLHSHGQGHETTFAQVAADALGVSMESIRLVQGDTRTSAFGMGTFASRSAVIGTGVVTRASEVIRKRLAGLAAHMLECAPEDIELRDGQASVAGVPNRFVTVRDIAQFAYWGGGERPADVNWELSTVASYDPGEVYTNGVVAAIVEVDVETGQIDLQQIVTVTDCGTMLNPTIVEGQVAGAVAQGIGGALYEEIIYSEDGQLQTTSLMEYLYPTTVEVPPMVLEHIESPSPNTVGGVKGVGEAGTIATPGAVANAIADALRPFGVRVESSPIGPSQVLDLIHGGEA